MFLGIHPLIGFKHTKATRARMSRAQREVWRKKRGDPKTVCEICGSRWVEYDDFVEYGEDGESNEGQHEVSMCSNEKCKNFQ